MQRTLATLAQQEEERKQKVRDAVLLSKQQMRHLGTCIVLKAFHDDIAARVNRVGKQAVADRKDRIEREERLIKQFEQQKEEERWERCGVRQVGESVAGDAVSGTGGVPI
eukprot:scaffold244132_cov18-Tisochrysis_lutea.AAC.1